MFDPRKISPQKDAASTPVPTKRPRKRAAAIAVGLALIAAIGGGTYWWYAGSKGGETFLTQKVVIGDVEDTVTAQGALQPLEFVDVGTQVSGRVLKMHVDYNDVVTKGQLLAEIDPTVYETKVTGSEAQLENQRAQLIQRRAERLLAAQQFERQKDLLNENATSKDAYDSADSRNKVSAAQITQLEAQIKQTESTLAADRANLGYTQIYAPMDGTIVDIKAKTGQTLNANQQAPVLLQIARLDKMKVWAEVSEADVAKLHEGLQAYFTTLGQPGRRYYGTLRQIILTPKNVQNVILYNAVFDVDNADHSLKPQMTAQVYFVTAEARGVPVVPVSALRPAPKKAAADIQQAKGEADTAQPKAGSNVAQAPTGGAAGGPAATPQSAQDMAAQMADPAKREALMAQMAQTGQQRGGRGGRGGGQGAQGAQNNTRPKQYLVQVREEGKTVDRIVEVGVQTRLSAEVRSGLSEGDEVVLNLAPTQNRQGQMQGFPGGFPGGGGGGFPGGGGAPAGGRGGPQQQGR